MRKQKLITLIIVNIEIVNINRESQIQKKYNPLKVHIN